MTLIDKNINYIISLCGKHKVRNLYAFGSVLSDDFNESSDIDFLVSFNDVPLLEYNYNYFDFKFSLQDLLKREIDLLEEKTIRNPYLKQSIDSSKRLIYGQHTLNIIWWALQNKTEKQQDMIKRKIKNGDINAKQHL